MRAVEVQRQQMRAAEVQRQQAGGREGRWGAGRPRRFRGGKWEVSGAGALGCPCPCWAAHARLHMPGWPCHVRVDVPSQSWGNTSGRANVQHMRATAGAAAAWGHWGTHRTLGTNSRPSGRRKANTLTAAGGPLERKERQERKLVDGGTQQQQVSHFITQDEEGTESSGWIVLHQEGTQGGSLLPQAAGSPAR